MKPSDARILALLTQPRTRKELVYETGFTEGQVTRALDRLDRLVRCWPDPARVANRPAFLYQVRETPVDEVAHLKAKLAAVEQERDELKRRLKWHEPEYRIVSYRHPLS